MEDCPDDVLLHVFSFLDFQSLCLGARMVCSSWRRLSKDAELWRQVEIPDHFTDNRLLLFLDQLQEHVEVIECSQCENLSMAAFYGMAEMRFPRLRLLAVPFVGTFPNNMYLKLVDACPALQEVENVRPNIDDTCDPLLCQSRFPDLRVIHDKPIASYGRIRLVVPRQDQAKRESWLSALTKAASVSAKVDTYKCTRGIEFVNDEGIGKISALFPNICKLELRQCAVTDEGLRSFFAQNKASGGLKELLMEKPGDISDKGIQVIADNSPRLNNIKISRCVKVTPAGVSYLASKCPHIEHIHLNNAQALFESEESGKQKVDFDNACLESLAGNLSSLRYLRVFYSTKISIKGIHAVSEGCPFLEGLMLFDCSLIDDLCLETMVSFRFLKAVVLVNCDLITPTGLLDLILEAPCVKKLTFYNRSRQFYGDMTALAEETYNKIDTNGSMYRPNVIGNVTLRGIGGGFLQLLTVLCPKLHTLNLREANLVGVHSLGCVIQNCEALAKIDVSSMLTLDDVFLKAVCEHGKALCKLSLGGAVKNMSTEAIADVIKTCPSLRMIAMDLHEASIDEKVLIQAAKDVHNGYCFKHVDPMPENDNEYVELHFTPQKYLGSTRTAGSITTTPSESTDN